MLARSQSGTNIFISRISLLLNLNFKSGGYSICEKHFCGLTKFKFKKELNIQLKIEIVYALKNYLLQTKLKSV